MVFINKFVSTILITLLLLVAYSFFGSIHQSTALSGNQFNPGRIIDDQLFFDGDTMSVSQIQSFLDAKVPQCDSNGQQNHSYYYNSGSGEVNNSNNTWDGDVWVTTSRATYGQRVYNANGTDGRAPYTCLKNFKQNTPSRPTESGLCSGLSTKNNQTAAQIINDVAKACGVSEKVLLVLLQKEQALIADDWPWPIQYKTATGFGCPDSTGCDSQYFGFFNQVYKSARQYKLYAANPTNYNHRSAGNNNIWYQADNPHTSQNERTQCGHSTVFIENQATAGLYNYTPYQPNQAALNNLYGEGNSCSSYGNRNFWRLYNDWFGTTTYNLNIRITTGVTISPSSPSQGQIVTGSFIVKNYENFDVTIGGTLKLAGRGPNGKNVDFKGPTNFTIPANSTYKISDSQTLEKSGNYRFWITSFRPGYGWSNSWPANTNSSIVRSVNKQVSLPNIRVTSSLNTSPSTPVQGQDISANFVVKNYETYPVKIDVLKAAARGPDGKNFDFPGNYNVIIPAKGTYNYSESRRLDKTGNYRIWIASRGEGYGWSNSYPGITNSSIIKTINREIDEANIRVTTSLSASPSAISTGQDVTASFIVKNYESKPVTIPVLKVAARNPSNKNVDFPGKYFITIPAKSTYTYSEKQSFNQPGDYKIWITSFRDWSGWSNSWPNKTNSSIIKTINIKINP